MRPRVSTRFLNGTLWPPSASSGGPSRSGRTPVLRTSAFAYFLAILGRFEEASAEATRALASEPMSPLVRVHVATAFFLARRFEEGLAECRCALEIDPSFALAYWAQSIVLTDLGRYDAALDIVQRALTSSWDFVPAAAGWIYTVAGQREKADEILASLRARSPSESRFSHDVCLDRPDARRDRPSVRLAGSRLR